MFADNERITWLASYPKSGNTWVRCLLQAYRNNGYVDINDLTIGIGDSSACFTRAVSPLQLEDLGDRGQWLLRPAALLNAMMATKPPRVFKTHYANVVVAALPAFIPFEFTQRAIYTVRDPRSVALSFSKYFSLSMDKTVEQMAHKEFHIGENNGSQIPQVISSWSNNVRSWASETKFPVHFVKYEDLLIDPLKDLKEMIEFMELEWDENRGKRAVSAAKLSKLRNAEKDNGFVDHTHPDRGVFFNKGGTRWANELGAKFIAQIESDHSEVMKELGYI